MEKGKRGKKPVDYSEFEEAEGVYLSKKSQEQIAQFNQLPESEKKKKLAPVKMRLKRKKAEAMRKAEFNEGDNESINEAIELLFKAIKKESVKLSEKQLHKIYLKVDTIKSKIELTKIEAAKREEEARKRLEDAENERKLKAYKALQKELKEKRLID